MTSFSRRTTLFLLSSLLPLSASPLFAESAKPTRLIGNPEASVLIEEYFSATCSHCRNFHINTFPTLKKEYIDTGRIAWQFRDFPLDKNSLLVAQIARCTHGNAYEKILNFFFQQQEVWAGKDRDTLTQIAVQAGFSQSNVDTCLDDKALQNRVIAELLEGQKKYGVQGTPSFVINGELQTGGSSLTNLRLIIGRALRS